MPFIFNTSAIVSAIVTAIADWFGIYGSLFWTHPWYDIPMHILGGLTMGFWAAAVASRWHLSPRRALFFIVGMVLVIGIAWEFWEYFMGLTRGMHGYWQDTIKDVIDDCIGSVIAWFAYKTVHERRHE